MIGRTIGPITLPLLPEAGGSDGRPPQDNNKCRTTMPDPERPKDLFLYARDGQDERRCEKAKQEKSLDTNPAGPELSPKVQTSDCIEMPTTEQGDNGLAVNMNTNNVYSDPGSLLNDKPLYVEETYKLPNSLRGGGEGTFEEHLAENKSYESGGNCTTEIFAQSSLFTIGLCVMGGFTMFGTGVMFALGNWTAHAFVIPWPLP